jgi:putative restriction endonuclease
MLGMAHRIFGHVPGYPEGSLFENRAELSESRVHVPIQAGIAGSQTEGAESIVLSGGYEDDADYDDVIRLVKIPERTSPRQNISEEPAEYSVPSRREVRASQIVRDPAQARAIKALYDNRCQICGIRLRCPAGPYSEAAHIRPLGVPHNGPDTKDNILCLCPNHHVLVDNGAISIAADLSLIGNEGNLTVHADHHINQRHLAYHREHLLVAFGS